MDFLEASKYIPNVKFMYIDVTSVELGKITGNKYVTMVNGITLVGSNTAIPFLADKAIPSPVVAPVVTTLEKEVPVALEVPVAPVAVAIAE